MTEKPEEALRRLVQWGLINDMTISFQGTDNIGRNHVEMIVHNDTLDAYRKLPGFTRAQIQGNWDG